MDIELNHKSVWKLNIGIDSNNKVLNIVDIKQYADALSEKQTEFSKEKIRKLKRSYFLKEGTVLYFKSTKNPLRVIAKEDFFEVLKRVHDGLTHPGVDKTWIEISSSLYGPKQKCIREYVKTCPICQRSNMVKRNKFVEPIISEKPFSRIEVDNGKEFSNGDFIEFVSALTGSPQTFVTSRRPQTNGMVEQVHITVYKRLHGLIEDIKTKEWSRLLPYCSFLLNLAESRDPKMPPSKTVYLQNECTNIEFLIRAAWAARLESFVMINKSKVVKTNLDSRLRNNLETELQNINSQEELSANLINNCVVYGEALPENVILNKEDQIRIQTLNNRQNLRNKMIRSNNEKLPKLKLNDR
ncbi:hypothetical protein BB558_006957, partial [Smittium angustum]